MYTIVIYYEIKSVAVKMKEYVKLIRGLISDFSLMLLNNDIVLGTINIVLRGFDVNNLNTFTSFLTSVLMDT